MQENRYYRFLALPFKFEIELPEFQNQKHQRLDWTKIPRPLLNFLREHDCQIGFAEVFKKEPGYHHELALHLDGVVFDDHVKINYVVNNNGSKMRWWRTKQGIEPKKHTTVVGTDYLYALEQDCDLLAEAELDQPALVNAGQFHSIHDIVNEDRYAFSFMIQKITGEKLLWDEAMIIFKDYIQ
jgi:hypothetical protein